MAKIMAYLGLNKTEFDRGMAGVKAQTTAASRETANIGRNFKGAVLAAAFRSIAASVGEYLDTVRESQDFSLISEEDVSRLDRYNAQLERGKNTILATIAAKASDAAGFIERAAATLGAMSGDSSMSMKDAWEFSQKISDEAQKQFDSEREKTRQAKERAEAEKLAAQAAKEIAASEAKRREEQSVRLAEMRGRYAQAALDPAKRREMAKEMREKERNDRKLASLANAAEYGMANGIEFSKLGKNKQLAWLAKQSDSFDPSKALVSIQEATKNIANALGVGASK